MRLSNRGFTLAELLLAAAILALVLTGLLSVFVSCIIFNETNRNLTIAYAAAQAKAEEVKNTTFDNLFISCPSPRPTGALCNGDTFALEGFSANDAQGKIEISNESTNLKRIRIIAWLRSRNRYLSGEDINRNLSLDSGEDINNNGYLDLPVQLITLIARK
jgi:prepilin-type N-terminal cleavage/methylation domain-containing protein